MEKNSTGIREAEENYVSDAKQNQSTSFFFLIMQSTGNLDEKEWKEK